MASKKSIEERLIASAKQALAIKRAELAPSREYDLPLTARTAWAESAPEYTSDQIVMIRAKLKVSQAVFAHALNVSLGTVRSWEQGIRYPEGAARRLLQLVDRDPDALRAYIVYDAGTPASVREGAARVYEGSASARAKGATGVRTSAHGARRERKRKK